LPVTNNTTNKLQFQFSKLGFPYLDFEQLRIIPFNVCFDAHKKFEYVIVNANHEIFKAVSTNTNFMLKFGKDTIIPTSIYSKFSKLEKRFMRNFRAFVLKHKPLSCEQLRTVTIDITK
jgi:hypothetical protein